jgi:transposase
MIDDLDPASNPFLAKCLALRAQGLTIRQIAEALGVPYSRVQRLLARYNAAKANGGATATLHKNDTAVHLPVDSGAP